MTPSYSECPTGPVRVHHYGARVISHWTLPAVFAGPPEDAVADLQSYFVRQPPDDSGPLYTGAMFEKIGGDQTGIEDGYTAADLIAVSMLSVEVPARVSIALLGPDAHKAASLLADIPPDLDLVDAPSSVSSKGSAAWELWDMLMAYGDIGPTTASKLIARKRPRLIPVQDSVVVATLHHPKRGDFWASMREALHRDLGDGQTLSTWLRQAREAAGIGPKISELRIFDVLVWLNGRRG